MAVGTAGPLWSYCLQDIQPVGFRPPLCLLTKVLLRESEYMLKLVLGNSLPLAFVLSLQPIPDFRDLRECNGDREEGAGKVDHGPKHSTF